MCKNLNQGHSMDWSKIEEYLRHKGLPTDGFERNSYTHTILSEFMQAENDHDRSKALYEMYRQERLEYLSFHNKQYENERIPEEVEQLARLCLEMGVPEIDPILIEAKLDELSERQREENKNLTVIREKLKNEKDQLASIEEFNEKLAGLLAMTKPTKPNPVQLELIKKKEAEYKARLAREGSQPETIIHLEEIERMLASIESCRKQSIKLESELAIFNKLPADWTLARVEVARAKRELDALLEERNRLLRQKCQN